MCFLIWHTLVVASFRLSHITRTQFLHPSYTGFLWNSFAAALSDKNRIATVSALVLFVSCILRKSVGFLISICTKNIIENFVSDEIV